MAQPHTFDQVLAAAKRGEDWAWEHIYHSLAGRLTGYLTLRGSRDPEDQTSETLLQVARNIHKFNGDESAFRSWVFVIAHRRLIDARRAAGRRPNTSPLDRLPEVTGGDVELEAMRHVETSDLDRLLAPLTVEQREVIILRMIVDLSLEETAKVIGKRIGAVKALQRRALASLKTHLESTGVSK
jgi:RNA polymerase sigma-70 factor (ECF subfamily)